MARSRPPHESVNQAEGVPIEAESVTMTPMERFRKLGKRLVGVTSNEVKELENRSDRAKGRLFRDDTR